MRHVQVVVAAAALLAFAGCSADNAPLGQPSSTAAPTTTGSPSAPTTLSSTGEPVPTIPPPRTSIAPLVGQDEVPPTQVDGGALNQQPRTWTSTDGRTVRIDGTESGCDRLSAEVIAQSGDQVLITLVTTKYAQSGACTADVRPVQVDVTLDAPLGSRRIVLESREEQA